MPGENLYNTDLLKDNGIGGKEMKRTKGPGPGFGVTVLPQGLRLEAGAGERLDRVLERGGIGLNLYCGGNGLCGKCAVMVSPSPGAAAERKMACRTFVRSDLMVHVPPGSGRPRIKTAAASSLSSFREIDLDPAVKRHILPCGGKNSLPRPLNGSIAKRLGRALGPGLVEFAAPDVRKAAAAACRRKEALMISLYDGRTVLDAGQPSSGTSCLGLAVDLGTTTVAVEIIDLLTGRVLSSAAGLNEQAAYGADVVSRLSFSFRDRQGAERLRRAAAATINGLTGEAARRAGLGPDAIYEAVVAGNTAMNHFLTGDDTDSLAVLPFSPAFMEKPAFRADGAGLELNRNAMVYLPPNIGGFVGGDITAGLAALDLPGFAGNALFIDLGTNGEIVVKKGGSLYASSTAVGPAFEGASISCGMLAVPGAVEKAGWSACGGFELQTIGGLRPAGLCGTGLIDVLALALEHGLLRPDGRIEAAERTIVLNEEGLALAQPDIRSVQTALAAVRTGVALTMQEAGLDLDGLDMVFVAGSFGNSLDIAHAQAVGLLPELPAGKVSFVGNASLAGARMLLLDRKLRPEAAGAARGIRHVRLAEQPGFQEIFASSMRFGRSLR